MVESGAATEPGWVRAEGGETTLGLLFLPARQEVSLFSPGYLRALIVFNMWIPTQFSFFFHKTSRLADLKH